MALARDQPGSPDEMPAVASPVPSDHLEEDPNGSTLSSEGSQSKQEQEAQRSDTPAELTPASSNPVTQSSEVENKEGVVSYGPTEAHASDVGGAVEDTPADPVPLKPAAEEAVPILDPEREEDTCPDVPNQNPTSLSLPSGSTDEKVQAGEMPPPAPIPPNEDSRSVLIREELRASSLFQLGSRIIPSQLRYPEISKFGAGRGNIGWLLKARTSPSLVGI